MSLTFDQLREANIKRLPQFKNCHGEPAHKTDDGSDWTPAQWLQALVGEIGEFAAVRCMYENGQISRENYEREAARELADIQTYLDILALRSCDILYQRRATCPADTFMRICATLGEYANSTKKFNRGDIDANAQIINKNKTLRDASSMLSELRLIPVTAKLNATRAAPTGINLGEATRAKFNEVSKRVGSDVLIEETGIPERTIVTPEPAPQQYYGDA